jgi:hypothetical protein
VTGVIAGNISDEATTRVGNIFAEAMRGGYRASCVSSNSSLVDGAGTGSCCSRTRMISFLMISSWTVG